MKQWIKVAKCSDFLENGGGCIQFGDMQIAVFNFDHEQWYAVQNLCPHSGQMVLCRGLIGDQAGEPKVACPLHKAQFSLTTGQHLNGQAYQLTIFPVKEEAGHIYLQLDTPSQPCNR